MKKKVLALFLTTVMVASLAACGKDTGTTTTPSDSGDKTTTDQGGSAATDNGGAAEDFTLSEISVVVNGTLTATVDNGQNEFVEQWNKAVSEKLGHEIKMNITQLDHSGYTDAVGRLFVSGDTPDVMIMSADMFKQYAPTGVLWDMAAAYDSADFQSHMILPAINEGLKDSEGHLYGFAPTYGNGCVTYVKKAWLDAVGLNIDDIKTFDDYYNMLVAFHDGDPDGNGTNGDTYGVVSAGYMGNEAPWINYLPEFWQDAYPSFIQGEDGVWYDGFNTDATKEALKRIRQAYVDGAIDPESLTNGTKQAREKWFSNDQTGSAGVFTYWAGSWYQTLTDNLVKNAVDSELVQLPPIQEIKDSWGGYLNREAPVWVILDDGDGNDAREQAIFDAFFETMMDGGTVQTLWTYGAEDIHWSTKAGAWKTNEGTDKEKSYSYEEGVFHLLPSPNDANSMWKKNALDPALVICSLDNGFVDMSELAVAGNSFFTTNCVDAPASPSSETFTNEAGTINDAKLDVITKVVVNGADVDTEMDNYVTTVGSIVDTILGELNAQ